MKTLFRLKINPSRYHTLDNSAMHRCTCINVIEMKIDNNYRNNCNKTFFVWIFPSSGGNIRKYEELFVKQTYNLLMHKEQSNLFSEFNDLRKEFLRSHSAL